MGYFQNFSEFPPPEEAVKIWGGRGRVQTMLLKNIPFHITKYVHKFPFFSSPGHFGYFNAKRFFWVIPKITSYFMMPKLLHSQIPLHIWKWRTRPKKIKQVWISQEPKESFRWNNKHFPHFLDLLYWQKLSHLCVFPLTLKPSPLRLLPTQSPINKTTMTRKHK